MQVDMRTLDAASRYKIIGACITPRPIAWVSSLSAGGVPNLAPYSFFNAIGNDPPMVVLGLVAHPAKGLKDTAANIRETGEFIVHLVDEAHAEAMNHSSVDHPFGVDEGALLGLDMVPGIAVAAPRVASAPVGFECRARHIIDTGPSQVAILGEIVHAHIADAFVTDATRLHFDISAMKLISRLHGAGWYGRQSDMFEMLRPPPPFWSRSRMMETCERASVRHAFLSTPEEIIDEARNGRMFILVDDEDRENEGDLVIPAQMATPDAINFMARHGRGLVCLAMTKARVEQLGLGPMTRTNGTRHETAFTVSIEAREGVTTGISAADRARTIAVAIDANHDAASIVTPGHVFPLVAREGGVLVRAGHTEAAVDVSRLAGLNPSGVICEIMNDDGTMARMDDLVSFAQLHNLKIGTIRDLIAYRRRHDHLVEKRAETVFDSEWGGAWRAMTFWNKATGSEQVALVKGEVRPDRPTLVRMHSLSPFTDMFGETGPRAGLLAQSMRIIAEEGAGVVVVIDRPRADGLTLAIHARSGAPIPDREELRDYGVGAMILNELGVEDIILLTNSRHTLVALDGYGLAIVGERVIG